MKKRMFAALLTVALLGSLLAPTALAATKDAFGDDPAAYDELLYGDVNLDGKLDVYDYLLLKRAVLGSYSLAEGEETLAADVDKNGDVNAIDYLLVKRSILGSLGSLGVVEEELSPNVYASLTDEELYALIDGELASDPDKEGQNLLLFTFKRIKRESQGAAVLSSLGFAEDLYNDPSYLRIGHATNLYLVVVMEVPEEQLREAIFKLRRCDEIGGCLTHGDRWSYPEESRS